MLNRRTLLQLLSAGAAAACLGLGSAHAADLAAFESGNTADSPPWWLIAPLQQGSAVGMGWRVDDLSKVEKGAAILRLRHRDGRSIAVHICAREGRPRGIAASALFDLILMDGAQGEGQTEEGLGRALLTVASRIKHNELQDAVDPAWARQLLSHLERVERFGPDQLA